jgi:hypothetical protein
MVAAAEARTRRMGSHNIATEADTRRMDNRNIAAEVDTRMINIANIAAAAVTIPITLKRRIAADAARIPTSRREAQVVTRVLPRQLLRELNGICCMGTYKT